MRKKILASAITIASINAAYASTFLSDDPIEGIYDFQTAFDNPANLSLTSNQITAADNGQIGVVFEAFGQKLGATIGESASPFLPNGADEQDYGLAELYSSGLFSPASTNPDDFQPIVDRLDLFWSSNFSFGNLGVQATYGSNSDTGLFQSTYDSQVGANPTVDLNADGNGAEDDGTNLYSIDVSANENTSNNSFLKLTSGIKLNDLPLDVSVGISLPKVASIAEFKVQDNYSAGASGGATATAFERVTQEDLEKVESTGGLVLDLNARYRFNQMLDFLSTVNFHSAEVTSTRNYRFVNYSDTNADNTAETNTTTTLNGEVVQNRGNNVFAAGADYHMTNGQARLQLISWLRLETTSTETTASKKTDTVVDSVAATTTTNPTGTVYSEVSEMTVISLPIAAALEYDTSEKWTWRAGAKATILTKTSTEEENSSYRVNSSGDGYEVDETQVTTNSSGWLVGQANGTVNIGVSYSPIPSVTFDARVEKALFENGLFNDGPIENGSLAVTITY